MSQQDKMPKHQAKAESIVREHGSTDCAGVTDEFADYCYIVTAPLCESCGKLSKAIASALCAERSAGEVKRAELLAACKSIAAMAVSWQSLSNGDIADVRKAIARAEGK